MRDDEDRPRPKVSHAIGQDLSLLSVEELEARIALLGEEIERLNRDREKKLTSRSAADAFFKL
jgi:uncharacterized small protein (DUF1192 family)